MKRLAIVGLVLLLIGVLAFGIGYWLTDGDLSVLNGSVGSVDIQYHDGSDGSYGFSVEPRNGGSSGGFSGSRGESGGVRTMQFDFAGVTRLALSEDAGNVEVVPSADGDVHLYGWEEDNYPLRVTEQNGVVTVKRGGGTMIGYSIGIDASDRFIRVELPAAFDGALELEVDTGNLSMDSVAFGRGTIDADAGNVEIRDVSVSGPLEIDVDAGGIFLRSVAAESLTADCDIGSIELLDVLVESDLMADCDTGDISVEELSAGRQISLRCDVGNVEGTLAGSESDYAIRASAGAGSNSLQGTRGGGSIVLDVRVDVGTIDLSFSG